jgi:hypothetical protein
LEDAMKMNRPLLRAVAKKLRGLRHEGHYDQTEVMVKTDCGTAACIGGWAAKLAPGVKVDWPFGKYNLTYKGRTVKESTLVFARRRLGINKRLASWLFSGGATLAWPDAYAQRLAGGERPSRVAADLLDAIADGKVKPSDGYPGW